MLLAADRPYFAPYPGFFQKARSADTLVLLDLSTFDLLFTCGPKASDILLHSAPDRVIAWT